MASKNETVAKVIDDFAYLITLGNIRPAVATNIKSRIEAAHKRKVVELERKVRDANLKYRAEKARHTGTYKDARIKAQDEEMATLKREVAELRKGISELLDALQTIYDEECTDYGTGEVYDKWRKALKGASND